MQIVRENATRRLALFRMKKTQPRIAVLEQMLNHGYALSQADIEALLRHKENRVTVYRVLKDLESGGIVHRVVHHSGTVLFALCADCSVGEHRHDDHIHFTCSVCQRIYCLDHFEQLKPSVPNGFEVASVQVNVSGRCSECSMQAK